MKGINTKRILTTTARTTTTTTTTTKMRGIGQGGRGGTESEIKMGASVAKSSKHTKG